MTLPLPRLQVHVSPNELPGLLTTCREIPLEQTGYGADLELLDQTIEELIADPKVRDGAYDLKLVEPLHRALRHLSLPVLRDMRLWQYLTLVRYPHLVWHRWLGKVPEDSLSGLQGEGRGRAVPPVRFLGSQSLNGFGRNTFSRLYFAADRVVRGEDYTLARALFRSQELHLGLMDREFGLCSSVTTVMTEHLSGSADSVIREQIKRMNHIGGGLVLDVLCENEIARILCIET